MLAVFFLANAVTTGALIAALQVRAPVYHAIPWIFAGAFAASCVPWLGRQMTRGPAAWRLLPALLYAAVITLASSVSPQASGHVPSDMFHPFEFAGLAFVAQLAAAGGASKQLDRRRRLWVALACLAVAILDEVHQYFVPGRSASATDVLLDALGIALGTLALATVARVVRPHLGA